MQEKLLQSTYKEFTDITDLPAQYSKLLVRAKDCLTNSWSPYSDYKVGAAVLLDNGQVLAGANQENAAYPMCLCAERVALGAVASQFPGVPPVAMAITTAKGSEPAAPCGACRQVLAEHEYRFKQPITIILQAQSGVIYVFDSVKPLLPFSFHL
jgi:cytidine deaminase